MTLKKILAGTMAGALLLTAAPIIVDNIIEVSIAEAAKGGSKINIPKSTKSAPKVNTNKSPAKSSSTKSSTSKSKSVSSGGKEYKPSKSAKDLSNTAPTAKSNTAASKAKVNPAANTDSSLVNTPGNTDRAVNRTNVTPAANTSSTSGNTLSNIGLFAGGMLLGGLMGSLLGDVGGGSFSDVGGGLLGGVLGLLFNIAVFYALYKGGRYLWGRFKGNKSQNRNLKQNHIEDSKPIDITPPQASSYPAKSTIGMDYEAKRAADYYRQL